MASTIILDDSFVQKQLAHVAFAGRALLAPTHALPELNSRIKKCEIILKKHHGYSTGGTPSRGFIRDQNLLNLALAILGHRLNLYHAFAMFERTIEVDWFCHTELGKAKRYRDHITHPVRVTAIGWWFLHRSRSSLLRTLASSYRKKTAAYLHSKSIPLGDRTWKEIVELAWLATGLLHDCAFPLQYRLQSGLHLRKGVQDTLGILPPAPESLMDSRKRQAMLDRLESSWLVEELPDLDRRIYELCKERRANRFEHAHALLGGLHHCLAVEGKGQLHTLQGLVVQLAARAIITHHDKDEKKAAVVSDHLAALLFVSDNLQNWERQFLHQEQSQYNSDKRTFRPIVECREIRLNRGKNGYVAVHYMNEDEEERGILCKRPYKWCFEKFQEPMKQLENFMKRYNMQPEIKCSQRCCVHPKNFPK